ncbi:hypothetical protein [Pseudomonas sp. BN515]|uniref:hypothetical protein n=1 Tax=Pseudomonas sp. BN515 TaxID=2567892 RepID=UPI0024577E5E|nr:hypothetical protein [Pseudomonas sp. BN515]MDH4874457.1 hypothetical protein [Pseudomonas sp. BN515]
MRRWMLLVLVLLTGNVLASPPAEISANAQSLHQLRSAGFALSANLLVYFNFEYGRAQEASNHEQYREALRVLREGAASLGGAERHKVGQIEAWVADLEEHAGEPTYPFSISLNRILEAHSQLDGLLGERYRASAGSISRSQSELNALSLDASRMQLLYLTFTFRTLIVYIMDSDDGTVAALNQRIEDGFSRLALESPEAVTQVQKARMSYVFVRERMEQLDKSWLPNSVEYYMRRVVRLLDQAAVSVG